MLFLTGDGPLSSADNAVIDDLDELGIQVQVVLDDVVATTDAKGKDLVLISESVLSSRIGNKFSHADVPVVVYESWLYDDLGMSKAMRGDSYGNASARGSILMQGAHPLTGGLTGTVQVNTRPADLAWAKPGDEAIVAATFDDNRQRATIFAYETGATMANGQKAPARRVGLFPHVRSIASRTTAGRDLFLAAVAWALAEPEDVVRVASIEQGNIPIEEPLTEPANLPVVESPPSQEPVVESPSAPLDKPLEESPAVTQTQVETKPAQLPDSSQGTDDALNLAPQIVDTSYQCDPDIEAVAYSIGDEDFFTLSVDDESPLTLKYDSDSSSEDVASVSVDGNGVFKVRALSRGETFLWLTAKDVNGLADEFELRIVVE